MVWCVYIEVIAITGSQPPASRDQKCILRVIKVVGPQIMSFSLSVSPILERQLNGQHQQPGGNSSDMTTQGLNDGEKIPTRTETPKKI